MRYLPLTDTDRRAMLARIGVPSIDSLLPRRAGEGRACRSRSICRCIWASSRWSGRSPRMAAKNLGTGRAPSFLGAGAYRHHVPAAVDHLIQRGEFLTSYTPYQPEVTQGTLRISVRVPDPGRAAHRHGCRQRLDV